MRYSLNSLLLVALLLLSCAVVDARSSTDFRPRSAVPSTAATREAATGLSTKAADEATELLEKKLTTIRGGEVSNTAPTAIAGVAVFAVIEQLTKMALKAADIDFPGQLGACIALFVVLCFTDLVSPGTASAVYQSLTPAAAMLAKWLPVFFVPGLALLPLSPPIGGPMDVAKVLVSTSLGFVYSISTTVWAVLAMRTLQGKSPPPKSVPEAKQVVERKTRKLRRRKAKLAAKATSGPPPKPFSDQQWKFSAIGSVVAGIVSIAASKTGSSLATPLNTIFMGFLTYACYIWAARLPTAFTKIVHPLVTSAGVLLLLVQGIAAGTGEEFRTVLSTYKTGTLDPMKAGAADYLLYILGPFVVSFAVSVFSRKSLLFANLPMLVTAMLVSSAGGLFGTAAFVRLIRLGGESGAGSALLRLSVLARNFTTALAMALTDMIGGDISIVAAVVILTGIIGASFGKPMLAALGIEDPICRGLGIGSSSQGLGVAALADEPEAFPFAAISMVLTAVAGTTLVSFPVVRNALIRVATGQAPAP